MQQTWCKVATNLDSHPKIRRAGRNGREVFLFALRKNMEPGNPVRGLLPGPILDPWYLSDQLLMSEAEAIEGLNRCVNSGLLIKEGNAWKIGGWKEAEWGLADSTERTRKWRARGTDSPPLSGDDDADAVTSPPVTVTPVTSPTVTVTPVTSPTVTCDGVTVDKRRQEETRQEKRQESRPPAEAFVFADELRRLVLEAQPTNALAGKPWGENGARLAWAKAIDAMHRRDARAWADIPPVLDWLFHRQVGDAKFVVHSPDALREKWDRIAAAMDKPQSRQRQLDEIRDRPEYRPL
jgi:hypothetical protein